LRADTKSSRIATRNVFSSGPQYQFELPRDRPRKARIVSESFSEIVLRDANVEIVPKKAIFRRWNEIKPIRVLADWPGSITSITTSLCIINHGFRLVSPAVGPSRTRSHAAFPNSLGVPSVNDQHGVVKNGGTIIAVATANHSRRGSIN
jgi:hypothetical protein